MRPKLVIATTAPISLDKLLTGQLAFLNQTFDVIAISAGGRELDIVATREGVAVEEVPMVRPPSLLSDLRSLAHLIRAFRRIRPDIVHAYTPKAGLLAMVAARLCSVPWRVRTVTGLPLMTRTGLRRRILIGIERISYWAATHVLSDSGGIRSFIADTIGFRRVSVLAEGSVNGVDTEYFSADAPGLPNRTEIRTQLAIPAEAFVILFVGRIVRDKGVTELTDAFRSLAKERKDLYLLLVGGPESADPVQAHVAQEILDSPRIVETGFVDDVRQYMVTSDLLVLPSYREGLPNVLLQGGSLGMPMVATDIPGCRDVLMHERSGLLVPPMDPATLADAIERLVEDPELRARLGENARSDIQRRFDQGIVWKSLHDFYAKLLAARV